MWLMSEKCLVCETSTGGKGWESDVNDDEVDDIKHV